HRRSLYTFAKRTAPFAAYLTFDGPTGESCIARRDRSNTPLQALTLLNDEMFLEAARALAKNALDPTGLSGGPNPVGSPGSVATAIFRRALTREPTPEELADLLGYFEAQRARFVAGELDAAKTAAGEKAPSPELAAWILVARAVLNFDEAVTRG
ncbi:MAG: DUF1553 domain-containing protein, partial [Verrucomicrobiae bacterium]|nr:DUF1553 domain-containing protein [Verrucomicrobiae bacterium]